MGLIVAYGIATLVIDRFLSSRPSRETLFEYLDGLERRASAAGATSLVAAIDGARRLDSAWFGSISTTRVLAGWRRAHQIELQLVPELARSEVLARLRSARWELQATTHPGSHDLSKHIESLIAKSEAPLEDLRASLQDALRIVLDTRDSMFESLADLQGKSAALALFGLAAIALAGITRHREVLLLFGAAGGFLSRLGRLLQRKASPTDYGVSSASLLLAPVSGALAGWVGVLLLQSLSSLDVLDAKTFGRVWTCPVALSFGLAFVFGFSERFFGRVISATEGGVLPSKAK